MASRLKETWDITDGPNLDELPPRESPAPVDLAAWHRAHLLDPQRNELESAQ